MKTIFHLVGFTFALLIASSVHAQTAPNHQLLFTVLSAQSLSGTAGDFVTVNAEVRNTGAKSLNDVTTYLSLVDTENKLPVDLEDWSAEKGRFIGTIEAGQMLPLNWKIHFVKAGQYHLSIVADIAGNVQPEISTVTRFSVLPKKNLNPGQVLPVALIVPLIIVLGLLLINYLRGRDVDAS